MNSRRTFLKTSVLLSSAFALPKLAFSNFQYQKAKVLLIGDSISIGYTPFVKESYDYAIDEATLYPKIDVVINKNLSWFAPQKSGDIVEYTLSIYNSWYSELNWIALGDTYPDSLIFSWYTILDSFCTWLVQPVSSWWPPNPPKDPYVCNIPAFTTWEILLMLH